MTLFEQLQQATSEEDVKDAYIKALGLKGVRKNLIDIQTDEVWFEAKADGKNSTYEMFTQLLHYVYVALKKGDPLPPLLCVIDPTKAAIMRTSDALPYLEKTKIDWGRSGSSYTQLTVDTISPLIGTHFVSFRIQTHEREFIDTLKVAIKKGDIIRTQITPANLKQVFDKWVEMIGREIKDVTEEDYALLFFADVMSDGTVSTHKDLPAELLHKNNSPVFMMGGKLYELERKEGYIQFWAIYDRPPREEHRDYLLERRDSLIPVDERSFKGAFFTPLHVVDKAYDKLNEALGENWQKEYIVWDMCCGVGNLEVKHSNHRNLFMSTLDQPDVDVMKATKTCAAATRFQYDYLNDDVTYNGGIDYSLTKKVPENLQKAIAGGKKILVLINPPYAEASEYGTGSKENVAKTKFAEVGMENYGKAKSELFTQFLARIAKEMPNAVLAMFSTLKYVNASNFEEFRECWNAKYLGGFIVHSKAFDGIDGNFPIGFLIWQTAQDAKEKMPITEVEVEVFDKKAQPIGAKKFYNLNRTKFLSTWVDRPKTDDTENIPLKNAVSPASEKANPRWSLNAVGFLVADSNDMQQAAVGTVLLSGANGIGHKGGFYVIPENLWQVAVIFSVRRLIKPTWQNDRDQFLQPEGGLTDEFKGDCLIWMLFNGSNLSAGADGLEWKGKTWSLVNHFIPYTEQEVGAHDRFESDFMTRYMSDKTFSLEALRVLEEGKELWRKYFAETDPRGVRDEFKLNRPDVGWYQIRNALKRRNESGEGVPVSFESFENAYGALTEKLRPMVYELGFLKA